METAQLRATPRPEAGKSANRTLRAGGKIPAVVYGYQRENAPIAVSPKEVVAILNGPRGFNTPIELTVEGEATPRLTMIRDHQLQPWRRTLQHIDFWEITPETVVTVTVPFERVGRSAPERAGGKVRQTRKDLKIRCVPSKIPASIQFDMTAMPEANANITVSQIPMPEGIEAVWKHDFSLIQIKMPKVVATEAAPEKGKKGKGKK